LLPREQVLACSLVGDKPVGEGAGSKGSSLEAGQQEAPVPPGNKRPLVLGWRIPWGELAEDKEPLLEVLLEE
jgi:hypothetical protein